MLKERFRLEVKGNRSIPKRSFGFIAQVKLQATETFHGKAIEDSVTLTFLNGPVK
jgi:hypothetical protein